jgi:hypothetical protein
MSHPVRVRLAALFWLAAVSACNCGTTPIKHSPGTLYLTSKDLNFHKVCRNDTLPLPLQIQNTGRGILTLTGLTLSGSSAYTISQPPMLPTTIAPNGSLLVTVVFAPTAPQDYVGTLTITSDDEATGPQKITLIGQGDNGEPKNFQISCDCNRNTPEVACGLASMGDTLDKPCTELTMLNVPDGTYFDSKVHLINAGCGSLTVTSQFYNDDMYSSTFALQQPTPITLHGGETQDVTVRFSPPAGMDQINPNVRLKFVSDDKTLRQGQVDAGTWDMGLIASSTAASLVVDVTRLAFFDASTGRPSTKTFTVSNAGNAPLKIDSIAFGAGSPADFQFVLVNNESTFTLAPTGDPAHGDSRTESITFSPTQTGSEQATVTITAGQQKAQIQLFGGIEPQLTVTWTADGTTFKSRSIDFGMTTTGATNVQRTVRLQNDGQANLNISSVVTRDVLNMTNSGSFSVPMFAATMLAPQQHTDVVVTFNDVVRIQNDSGKLAIASNDPTDASNAKMERVVDLLSQNAPNFPPTANFNAVPIAPSTCGSLTLDGTATTASQAGDTITYQWSIVKQPGSATAVLETPTAVKTRVLSSNASCMGADIPGSYIFKLLATDQFPGNSTSATQTVNVQ